MAKEKKPKESKEEKRMKKEAAKREKKEKKGKKGKSPAMEKVILEEERSLLIPILTALLVLVGVFTLAMAAIVGVSYVNSLNARQPSPQPSPTAERRIAVSQSASAPQNAVFQLDGE